MQEIKFNSNKHGWAVVPFAKHCAVLCGEYKDESDICFMGRVRALREHLMYFVFSFRLQLLKYGCVHGHVINRIATCIS